MKDWRRSKEYRHWRVKVIRRDKKCVICGSIKNRQAHHMNHATYFSDERFDPENGITLCASCHQQFHNNFKQNTRQKCTKEDFKNFKDLTSHYIKKGEELKIQAITNKINSLISPLFN